MVKITFSVTLAQKDDNGKYNDDQCAELWATVTRTIVPKVGDEVFLCDCHDGYEVWKVLHNFDGSVLCLLEEDNQDRDNFQEYAKEHNKIAEEMR